MDKWLKRINCPSRGTSTAATSQLTVEGALSSDNNPHYSSPSTSSTFDRDASDAPVAGHAESIATDSGEESDAEPPDAGKHAATGKGTTSSKRRKYDENYIALGFTKINTGGFTRPQCVICAKVLSHNSMKPSLLRRHLETKHANLRNKPREFFERELRGLSTSKTCIRETDTVNRSGLQASYMVSYRVAKTGKPHTIVEDIIVPAAMDMVGTMLGEKAKKTIQTMPSSNNTVSRRISDMAEDVLKQLLRRVRASEFYALQLDESTDVAGLAHVLVYVRYIHEGTIKEDMLFCKSLEKRATGEDIFKMLDTFVTSNGLMWTQCVGICTDGARAMSGRQSGVVTRVQAVAPDATWIHCSIHREALAVKGMSASLKNVLDTTVKMVNFVKARPLNSRIFSALCSEMGSDHETLLLHTEVRWLSRGKVLTRFFELKDELKIFFSDHNFHLSEHLHDEKFLTRLGYLSDIFSRLNELNLGLQGVSATIFNVRDKIEAMIKKLNLWLNCTENNNTEVFPTLHEFLCANELCLTDSMKHEITAHLRELAAQLRRYFPESDSSDSWIRHPFTDVPAFLSTSEQESLIEITTDGSLKMEFNQKPLSDFWIGLCTEYPVLAKRAVKTLMPFATTYMCESGFSALTSMKTKYRARLCVENNLRLRLSQIQPDIADLCASSHAHPSH